MAEQGNVTGYFSSSGSQHQAGASATPTPTPSKMGSSRALVLQEDSATIFDLIRSKVEWTKRIGAYFSREEQAERQAFKAEEDAKHEASRRALHQATVAEFGNAQEQRKQWVETNLARGNDYKDELRDMKAVISTERQEHIERGHQLTQAFKQQEAARQASIEEDKAHKQELGQLVKQQSHDLEEQLLQQRQTHMEQMQQHVKDLQAEKVGKLDEAMTYALLKRQQSVQSVKNTEDKWKKMTERQAALFTEHAHQNHEKNDESKVKMRDARKELQKKNRAHVETERRLKEEHAAKITQKALQAVEEKRAVREEVYSRRAAPAEEARVIKKVAEKAEQGAPAEKLASMMGVASPPKSPTPYHFSTSSPGKRGKSPSKSKSPSRLR